MPLDGPGLQVELQELGYMVVPPKPPLDTLGDVLANGFWCNPLLAPPWPPSHPSLVHQRIPPPPPLPHAPAF